MVKVRNLRKRLFLLSLLLICFSKEVFFSVIIQAELGVWSLLLSKKIAFWVLLHFFL